MFKSHEMFLLIAAGVFLAILTPINTIIASIMTPLISAVTSGKGAYV